MAEIQTPGSFGGLMRYNEEYNSKFKFNPGTVIGMIIATIAFVISLRFIFPISN